VSETGTTNNSFSGDEEAASLNDNKVAIGKCKEESKSERAAVIIQSVTSL